jgi:hypothetical protein
VAWLLNVLLGACVSLNLLLYAIAVPHFPLDDFPPMQNRPTIACDSPLRLPPRPPHLSYMKDELGAALVGLKLPTWSRGYVPCDDPASEVTCAQVVRAWRTIGNWSRLIRGTALTQRRWIQARHYYNGIGNRLSTDTIIFLLALMDNRSMVVRGFHLASGRRQYARGNAYEYDASILDWTEQIEKVMNATTIAQPFYIQVHDSWFDADFRLVFGTSRLMDLQQLIYSPMAYSHYQMAAFCWENFGMHAVYFMANFILKISVDTFLAAQEVVEKVPVSVALIGVHLRVQFPGQFYSHSFEQTMRVVTPFLARKMAVHPTVFAFASDSQHMERRFRKIFGPATIQTKAPRRPDYDHKSALLDMVFLEMANDCLLSFRSTFSFAIASRRGTRCYFVEKEAPEVFQIANSQAGSVSMQFHTWDVNDWQTARRYIVRSDNEKAMRYYYKYLMF